MFTLMLTAVATVGVIVFWFYYVIKTAQRKIRLLEWSNEQWRKSAINSMK